MVVPKTTKPLFRATDEQAVMDKMSSSSLAALLALVALFCTHAYGLACNDEDAYISFRYAQNLLDGYGLVFNPGGERVEGITNLLWTLILALSSRLTGFELPTLALVLGVVCGALTLVVAHRWCKAELEALGMPTASACRAALVVPALLAIGPGFALYAVSGLETTFFTLLVTGGLYAAGSTGSSHRVSAAAGVLLGAAAITRPDGVLVLAFGFMVCALCAAKDRKIRPVTAYLAPGMWVLFGVTLWRLWYYDSPVPNTFFAKAGGFEVAKTWGWPYLMEAAGSNWFQVAFLVALGGALLSRTFLVRNLAVLVLALTWCAYVVFVGGDYMPGSRFFTPILPALYVLAVPGFVLVGGGLRDRVNLPRRMTVAVFGFLGLALATGFALHLPDQVRLEASRKADKVRLLEYRRSAAEWLNSRNPEALVATNAVGAFGYYSDSSVLDMLGLNETRIARFGSRDPSLSPGHQVGDGRYVLSQRPDYIIPLSMKPEYQWGNVDPVFVGDKELANLPDLKDEYVLLDVELKGGQRLKVYQRKALT